MNASGILSHDTDLDEARFGARRDDDFSERPTLPASAVGGSVSAGELIAGRYRVVRELGHGGMGRVVLAEDSLLSRPVAIKLLHNPGSAHNVERFRREARLLASISHPHVVSVFNSGEHEGRPYFVMEYLEGPTLEHVIGELDGEWLPLDVVIGFAIQLCGALEAVHSRGIVHGDVKPGNIIITGDVRAVLMDFGLAQDCHARDLGLLGGTPHYTAPEDIRGAPLRGVDARRSDIYSLGVTLYELLAGRPPFDGVTPAEVHHQHLHATPPRLRDLRPDVPAGIEAVIRRALAKNPLGRPATCGEIVEELWVARHGDESVPLPIEDDIQTARVAESWRTPRR